jgi:hypothetical protein
MRRSIVETLLAVALISTLGPVPAEAREPTQVTFDCHHAVAQPRHILFACGDGGFYVRRLSWSTWHPFFAMGRGVFHQNACRPNCADGTFHTATGTIRLHHRQWCENREIWIYRRAAIVFDTDLLGRHREAFRLSCPFRR